MRSKRWLWVLSVWALMLGIGVAQPPLLVLTNGDVNGDNLVDDTDRLAVVFRMSDSCPQGCAEDLNGDLTVDDSDLLTVNFHMGAQGAPAFAGQVSAPQGAFRVALRLQLGDWAGASQSVKVQLKPVGREEDASVPIYEWTVSVGGSETEVELDNLPAGVYTVRAYPATPGRWLRTDLSDALSVPGGGGVQARDRFLYRYIGGPLYAMEVYNGNTRYRLYSFGIGSEGEARALYTGTTRKADLGYDSHYRLTQVTGGVNGSTGQRHITQNTYTEQNFAQSTIYPNNDTYTISQLVRSAWTTATGTHFHRGLPRVSLQRARATHGDV